MAALFYGGSSVLKYGPGMIMGHPGDPGDSDTNHKPGNFQSINLIVHFQKFIKI